MHPITLARKLARWIVSSVLLAAALLGSAGGLDQPLLWAYIAVCSAVILSLVLTTDADLARERRRPGPGGVDRSMRRWAGPLFLGSMVLACLDSGRFGWSGPVPPAARIAGLAVFAASMGLVAWAMGVNRFFSPVVRIQKERGHHLIASGPYRLVRHPGYSGMFFGAPASAVALGSWWALLPAAALSAIVLRRTLIEDRFLQGSLEGYRRFSAEVRYRLVPGLW